MERCFPWTNIRFWDIVRSLHSPWFVLLIVIRLAGRFISLTKGLDSPFYSGENLQVIDPYGIDISERHASTATAQIGAGTVVLKRFKTLMTVE